jgi:uridine phosphorylase
MSTLYMGADQETVAKYVLFSGDPWRVEVVKQYLENPKKVAFMREFNTYTGTYKGIEVTVTSTGIGAPSAAIAMEEMYEVGMENLTNLLEAQAQWQQAWSEWVDAKAALKLCESEYLKAIGKLE